MSDILRTSHEGIPTLSAMLWDVFYGVERDSVQDISGCSAINTEVTSCIGNE
jgi:hypothetical protein